MSNMCTLHEIAINLAKKQPGMVDSLTEESPILKVAKWKPATHGMWHNAETLTDIEAASFIEMDSPIPTMSVSSDLTRIDLHMLAGSLEVPSERARLLGGAKKYFADKQDAILRKSGNDTEKRLVMHNWLEAAKQCGNTVNAGGKSNGWFILAVRFDPDTNIGLYDPGQFEQGRLFKITFPYDGAEYHLKSKGYEKVLGFGVTYRANFGWMIIDPRRTCAAIVNIDEDNLPTPAMIDDLLSDVRAQAGSTFLFCAPKAKTHAIGIHKLNVVQMVNTEKDIKTMVDSWNGIPIIPSYNISEKIPNVKVA